ncbi:Uncharacterized protein C6orf150 [Cricetulus griseus]|uniref:Uncharacterized protein C6orf150 n=1 Tax=Cricetulus griseus TaxID=10029 RepID=G3HH41_CRIGR|nr:Uncharacterized protein C6orf150 [Cricetulus griseus]
MYERRCPQINLGGRSTNLAVSAVASVFGVFAIKEGWVLSKPVAQLIPTSGCESSLHRLFLAATCELTWLLRLLAAPQTGCVPARYLSFVSRGYREFPFPRFFPRSRRDAAMEGQCRRPTASRAKKPAAKRATTEPNRTVAAPSHAGGCGPQRGARSRRAEPDGVPTEQPRAQAPGARPGRTSVRIKDLQPSATGAAGDAEHATVPEPRPPAIPEAQPPVDPGAPDVARGPSRRRGARSVGQPGAPRGSRRKQEETPDKKLKKVLEKLRLKRKEISVAAEVVNGVVGQLLSRMQNRESEFKGLQQLNTGSYYERVKISAPNEFDVMFKLEVPRIQLQEFCDTGAFYLVKLRRISGGNPLGHFLEDEILSASKMLSKFREIIKEEVEKIKDRDVSVEEEKPGSPAVTLLIRNPEEISVDIILALESKGSWPVSTKEGLPIKNWLGTKVRTKLRREPFYLVPKNAKVENCFQGLLNVNMDGKNVKVSLMLYTKAANDQWSISVLALLHQAKQATK